MNTSEHNTPSGIVESTISRHSDGRTHVDLTLASGHRISGWLQPDAEEQQRIDEGRERWYAKRANRPNDVQARQGRTTIALLSAAYDNLQQLHDHHVYIQRADEAAQIILKLLTERLLENVTDSSGMTQPADDLPGRGVEAEHRSYLDHLIEFRRWWGWR